MIALSKLLITGIITTDTPKVVINDILITHNVDKISDLDRHKVVKVQKYPDKKSYEYIANFLNPYEKWEEKNLLKAWLFTQEFMGSRVSVRWNLNATGLPTNDEPYSLNVCMLYRICLEWSLPIKSDITTKHMINMIKISLIAPRELRVFICTKIKSNYDDTKDNETIINRLTIIKDKLVSLREPTTNCEAIALSASIYKKDITYSKCPIVDYYSKTRLGKYNDPLLLDIIKRNNVIIDLTETFNPIFPVEYYTRYDLRKFSMRVGFVENFLNTVMYSNLQFNHITQNFYMGWQTNMTRDTTYVSWYNTNERKDLICFGDHVNGFVPFVADELVDTFNYYKSLVNPIESEEELPERVISTLEVIAESRYPNLSAIIRRIKMTDNDSKDFSKWSNTLVGNENIYVRDLLTKILELGMYCRGWKGGKDPWPLKKRPYEEAITDGLVTIAFWPVYEEYSNKLGKKILDLPMYKYNFGVWKKIIDPKDGLSLYDRIKMIKDNPNVYACIRMSSNILVYTSYKYMTELGMIPPFNIDVVDHIC